MPARVLLGALPIAGCPSAARSTCTRPTRPRSFSHSLQIATDRLKGLERQHRVRSISGMFGRAHTSTSGSSMVS